VLKVFEDGSFKTGIDPLVMAGGMIAAAISGYFAVKFMLKILTRGNMKIFAYYVFVIGGLVLIDQLFFGRFFVKLF
jgi:undecaprenyl-diphosphatase